MALSGANKWAPLLLPLSMSMLLLTGCGASSTTDSDTSTDTESDTSTETDTNTSTLTEGNTLVINEIVAKDSNGGNDWIELYVTQGSVNLGDYSLIDDNEENEAQALSLIHI